LKVPRFVVDQMDLDEFYGWLAWMDLQKDRSPKARKQAGDVELLLQKKKARRKATRSGR
jgi:hypothetical protein